MSSDGSPSRVRAWIVASVEDGEHRIVYLEEDAGWAPHGEAIAWSPAGTELAFTTTDFRILVWSLRTGQLVVAGVGAEPSWSPDGSHIAAVRPETSDVWVYAADGSSSNRVGHGEHPTWSSDGLELAFTQKDLTLSRLTVIVATRDGTRQRILARLDNIAPPTASHLTWSPDGASLALIELDGVRYTPPEPETDILRGVGMASRVFSRLTVLDARDGSVTLRGDWRPWSGSLLSWSPDGRLIAAGQGMFWPVSVVNMAGERVGPQPDSCTSVVWGNSEGLEGCVSGSVMIDLSSDVQHRFTDLSGIGSQSASPDGALVAFSYDLPIEMDPQAWTEEVLDAATTR